MDLNQEQPPNATILIVDDDEDALDLLRMVMERTGYTVFTATNGLEAVSLAEKHGAVIESIILDLMMPGDLDGYAVCDRLKSNPQTTRIPIIVLSAKSSARDMMRSYAAGAFQHITKPYDIQYLIAVVNSMVRFRRLENEALENAAKYRAILDTSPLEMLVVTPDLKIAEMNVAFQSLYPQAQIGQDAESICHDFQAESMTIHPILKALRTGENQHEIVECEIDNKRHYRKVHAAPLVNEANPDEVLGILCITEDVTEFREMEERLRSQIERHNRALVNQDRISEHLLNTQRQLKQKSMELEKANEELERLSITDPLTQLYNRRHFDEVFESEARRSSRYNHPLSVLMIDLDHFKGVNDTHGHAIGDELLQEVARRFQKQLRETDTVARYGGEEFVALLPETEMSTALQIAERLRSAIGDVPIETSELPITITISIGVASETSKDISPRLLLQQADDALYQAKADGRNTVITSEPTAP